MNVRRLPWARLAAGAAVFALLAAVLAFAARHVHLPGPASPDVRRPLPRVLVAGGSNAAGATLAAETASLLGPSPLFLPTWVNASQIELPASSRREPGSAFPSFPAKLLQREDELEIGSASPLPALVGPLDVPAFGTTAGRWPWLGALPRDTAALSPRRAFVEVFRAQGGRSLLQKAVESLPMTPPYGDWRPVEMLLAVDPAGVISEPVVTQGSGLPEWDTALRKLVVEQVAVGLRLWPGFYSVRVGP
ncbi:hypothetical protein [Nibricoccus sp. IMCC34717]|uniref:hypothetical protein n=1 Tax=Nibricoccus sp. IMCC34717 TaxID=3034021 RepID=UPI0038511FEF